MERVTKENVLDQKLLRRVEALCTQEQPPACTAACPLHVDARGIAKAIAAGDLAGAFTLYAKAIPFPEIVSRSCDAPCEGVCKRVDIGGAIRIRDLERAICAHAKQVKRAPFFLPKRTESVAIVGGGLRGAMAALELAKKGISVTLFERTDRLGGALWDLPREVLPASAIEEDFSVLRQKYPISFRMEQHIDVSSGDTVAQWRETEGFDALYIACDAPAIEAVDADTLETAWPMVFTGHRPRFRAAAHSPISDMYDGKSAATSIERSLQNVSILAGREGEGGFETTLYTDLTEYAQQPPVMPESDAPYTQQDAQCEAARCIQCECLACVKGCAFLRHYKSYPKRYVREVYNNLSISMGTHHANAMINACSQCGQCGSICPNGLNMADIFLAARHKMVSTEKMPPSVHEFALLDMTHSNSDACFLARHQPGWDQSRALFFPSCQLAASEPSIVERAYADLCDRLPGGVGLMLGCCGVMARWAGRDDLFDANINQLRTHWEQLGKPQIIAACPTCLATLRETIDPNATGIWDSYADESLPAMSASGANARLFVHDACGARHDDHVRTSVRTLAARMGYQLEEGRFANETTPCCGYGGLTAFANKEVGTEMADHAVSQSDTPYLTYCVNCRDRFLARGKDATHLLELLFGSDAAQHQPPNWSQRQENRVELKRHMLQTVWKETIETPTAISLTLSPELEQKIDDCMILRSDIATCVEQAEATGARFRNPQNGHFVASHRPGNVTFWVEYVPISGGYQVYNAYSHRMSWDASMATKHD